MDSSLPIVYFSILLLLLTGAAFIILRQVFRTRKTESSLSRLQKKLRNEKGTAQEYYELGSIYLDKKLYTQAIVQFQAGLKSKEALEDENKALIYNALGFAYAAQDQYDLALRQYKEALKLYPEYVTAYNNLAFTYERKKLTTQALEAYEQALTLEPNNQTAKKRAESLRKRLPTTAQ